jgi:F-type H+-transporting ATPase subunit b
LEALGALGITPAGLIAYIINFGLLVVLLQMFLYKPVKNRLAERQQRIAESLEAADRASEEAAQQRQEFEKELAQAREKAQEEAREAAEKTEKMRQEILEDARKEAEAIKSQAREEAEAERQQVMADLRQQAAELAMQIARKIVGETIDEQKQRKMIDRFLADLGEAS